MISRIGTFSNANALMEASLRTQARLADQQNQQASTYKATTFGGLAGDAAKLLNLSSQSARLAADTTAATQAASQVQGAYSAAANIVDLATTVRAQLAAAISGSSGSAAVSAQTVSDWLATLQSELNTQVGGVYVFAGQASDQAPVRFDDPAYAPTGGTTPDTGYYGGSASARRLDTSQGLSVTLATTAAAPGFARLANALSMMLANPTDPATLQSAYDAVGTATTELGATQATLASQAATLDTIVTTNTDKATTLDNLASALDGADLATATVKVTQYQSQLEALYSAISKLSQNSILKYL